MTTLKSLRIPDAAADAILLAEKGAEVLYADGNNTNVRLTGDWLRCVVVAPERSEKVTDGRINTVVWWSAEARREMTILTAGEGKRRASDMQSKEPAYRSRGRD
jgi:hypothetical protein